ncbi:Y-family DNA polymerase [Opitutus terrae]|uniref:DNA polymerase IV n=1 Tax=Opitutus terrae (strain DSM 11246 / JCM 15787 / PB90-1) TaxID=452637 RepID=DPO4_OPITP|nr:DNA polymerase IV [Opitutus terrae]B1ZN03.1 RecName: Full=DNA polymerase IV; Short=Pol IV [Opitutus terrae PB90-1]ACB76455.1 DNA-directed DNA polymerase [Opitutus terrae PB90-1]
MILPTIVHLDADAFFVSCELALKPELRGTKCAVGGRERGIISSASYEARACGVYTPMPTTRALKVCPDLIMLPHTGGLYSRVSRQMFELCETLTPLVQRNSIDEGYLDLGPCGFKTSAEIEQAVHGLQHKIEQQLQITASFGLAVNKLVAQIASKLRKPKGFVVVPSGTEAEFLAPLPIGKLPGVGPKTEERLVGRHGIKLVRDLLARGEAELEAIFGDGWREMRDGALGIDDRPVETEHEDAKSYSQQETFDEDIASFAEIERVVKRMIDELLPKIREDGKRVRTMTVKVRYPDFSQESHGRSLSAGTDLEAPFYPLVTPLLRQAWTKKRPLRLVSVRFSGVEDTPVQLEMFAQNEEKRRRLAAVLDHLNRRGGDAVVQHGHQLAKRPPPR